LSEARAVLTEFMALADKAAWEFGWISNFPHRRSKHNWRKHGWKHVSFNAIIEIRDDFVKFLPPEMRPELIGPAEEARAVFRAAESHEPTAVARLQHLFPRHDGLSEATEVLFVYEGKREILAKIPLVEELAADWAAQAVEHPESSEAQQARKKLRLLVAKSSALGSTADGGRSRVPWHEEVVDIVFVASYCLGVQIRQVNGLLAKTEAGVGKRNRELANCYPQLQMMQGPPGCVSNCLASQPTQIACIIASQVLKISPSKIEKIVYRGRKHS
jgi:hypothetical protein